MWSNFSDPASDRPEPVLGPGLASQRPYTAEAGFQKVTWFNQAGSDLAKYVPFPRWGLLSCSAPSRAVRVFREQNCSDGPPFGALFPFQGGTRTEPQRVTFDGPRPSDVCEPLIEPIQVDSALNVFSGDLSTAQIKNGVHL